MGDDVSSKRCLLYDYGNSIALARRLAREFGKVDYFCPWKDSLPQSVRLAVGTGFPEIERVRHFHDAIHKADLIIFTDIYDSDIQHDLINRGKRVWGSGRGDRLEYDRPYFLKALETVELPVVPYRVCEGVDELEKYLKRTVNKWVKLNLRGDCFDCTTEVFTDHGWKYFSDLLPSDKVATMPIEGRQIEFVTPAGYIKQWHDGDAFHIKTKAIDALVTPNHHFWMRTANKPEWRYQRISEIYQNEFFIPLTFRWVGVERKDHVIENAYADSRHKSRNRNIAKSITMDDWLSFLGWFVSEGSLAPVNGRYRISLAQSPKSNPEKYEEIKSLLNRLPWNIQREGQRGFSIYDKSAFVELARTCYADKSCSCCGKRYSSHNKKVPEFVKGLSERQIEIFLSSYGKGDGSVDKRSGQMRYYTSSKFLADDIQELIFKTGNYAAISTCSKAGDLGGVNKDGRRIINKKDAYCIGVSTYSDDARIRRRFISKTQYCGYVYDVTVPPHHTLFVRRNGKAFWSGNSETWNHITWDHFSQRVVESYRHRWGPIANDIVFTVVDHIDSVIEAAYDGHFVTSPEGKPQWPDMGFLGYEDKDKSHILTAIPYASFPDAVREVNDAFAPMLASYYVRSGFGTEIKIVQEGRKQVNHFIDLTARQPDPPGPIIMEMVKNLGKFFWHGSVGELIPLEIEELFGVQVNLYSSITQSNWSAVEVPEEYDSFVKLKRCCMRGGVTQVIPEREVSESYGGIEQIGCVVATSNKIEDAIDEAKEICEQITAMGLSAETDSLVECLRRIKEGEKEGIAFTEEEIPEPETVIAENGE